MTSRRGAIGALLVASVGLVLLVVGVRGLAAEPAAGGGPMTPVGAGTPPAAVTTSAAAGGSTSSRPSTTGPLRDPRGAPVRIVLRSGAGVLINAPLDPATADAGVLQSAPGRAAWYASAGWPRPGVLSANRSVVVGHVRWSGRPDAFVRLPKARVGDLVTVSYDSADQAVFRVDRAPVEVDKATVTSEADGRYRWVWRSDHAQRVISLFTCDVSSGERSDGHLRGNWVVQAVRIS